MFLSLSGVVGKTKNEVESSLAKYTASVGGIFQKENLTRRDLDCCVIGEAGGNTTIVYPSNYFEWDNSSAFISKDLNAPVFSLHIHDGDLWMYILFVNGTIADQFNPIPNYWDDSLSEEEIASWQGNAANVSKHLQNIDAADIENYLVRWNLDAEESPKAYPNDNFLQEDWQLLDFMKKLNLPYPLDVDGEPKTETYKLWVKDAYGVPLTNTTAPAAQTVEIKKPWWKFW